MRRILPELIAAVKADGRAALVTVVRTWQSAPREAGAGMVVTSHGEVVGSVSGGCVEADLIEVAVEVIESGGREFRSYGVSDATAFEVGLTCGGTIDVVVECVGPAELALLESLAESLDLGEPVAVARAVDGPIGGWMLVRTESTEGSLGSSRLDYTVVTEAAARLQSGTNGLIRCGTAGERLGDEVTIQVLAYASPPRLIIVGSVDHAAALASVGHLLGYRTIVVDARPRLTTTKRFPSADHVVVAWPQEWLATQGLTAKDAVCVLTHDVRFDVAALHTALGSGAGYVGAMGSRATHEDRVRRMKETGLSDDEIGRIHSPIGLDLGGVSPEETAISIGAELVRHRWGGSGDSLRDVSGPIHRGGSS